MDHGIIAFWGGFALLFLITLILRHLERDRMTVNYAQRGMVANEATPGAPSPKSSFATARVRAGRRFRIPTRNTLRGWKLVHIALVRFGRA